MRENKLGKEIETEERLREVLERYVAPAMLGLWGTKDYKTGQSLYGEIAGGDCVLKLGPDGLRRMTKAVFVDVMYCNGGQEYILKEDRQEFSDGRARRRNLPGSAGEKVVTGESFKQAVKRLIKDEELKGIGLSTEGSRLIKKKKWRASGEANSYPGLVTKSENVKYEWKLRSDQGKPKDFSVREEDTITYFVWVRE